MKVTIYHKTTCSKSCEALNHLKKNNADYNIIEYLETPPTAEELNILLKKLGMKAEDLIRKKESIFQEKFEGQTITEKEWIEILVKHPILIERPIIVKGNKAIIGRPTERVDEFLKS